MRRLLVAVFLIALGAVVAVWLAMEPGAARISFQGWVVETSFAVAAVVLLTLGLVLALLWRGVGWLIGLPGQMRRSQARARIQRGYDALERALIASAAGDGSRARRQAARAGELLDRPLLSRVISARAAEAAGELESAEADYRLLLESPETEIVGLRGLAQAALSRGDIAGAQRHAEAAFARNPQARWAFETLFDAQVRAAAWSAAVATLDSGERHNHLPGEVARRRRAVLLTADAAASEATYDLARAREQAMAGHQAYPGFAPAAVLAARLLVRDGQDRKAARVLEEAWRAGPHPALAMAWRERAENIADPAARAAHLDKLARLLPDHREGRILAAEAALMRGEAQTADAMLGPIAGPRTARLCALQARIAEARGDHEAARRLILEAAGAPGEADWSDVDPYGPAFAFTDADWARLVYVFGAEGKLIHPRHERFLPELIAAPALPLLSAPVYGADAADTAAPPSPDDPGPSVTPHGDADAETDDPRPRDWA